MGCTGLKPRCQQDWVPWAGSRGESVSSLFLDSRGCLHSLALWPLPLLPWWLCRQCGRPGFDPWVGKIPWSRKWHPTPVFLPGKFHGPRSLVSYSQSTGSQRVGQDWETSLSLFTFLCAPNRQQPAHLNPGLSLSFTTVSIFTPYAVTLKPLLPS